MSTVKANTYQDASGGSNAILYGAASPAGSMGFRNRIINGDMRIDQRNSGASVSVSVNTTTFITDRFNVRYSTGSGLTSQQSTTAPTGFVNSLLLTVGTGASLVSGSNNRLVYNIEGRDVADLGWGTANAKTVTLSFWVRSSLTGTFSFAFQDANSLYNYVGNYSISSANTWEYKTATVSGPTTGTWNTDNNLGIQIVFDLGSGSNYAVGSTGWTSQSGARKTSASVNLVETSGATFYLTGLQLEVGSVATEFERRPYGTELALCQRYYIEYPANSIYCGFQNGTTSLVITVVTPVTLRASPSMTLAAGTSYVLRETTTTTTSSTTLSSIGVYGVNQIQFSLGGFSGLNDLRCANLYTGGKITLSAEL